MASAAKHFDKEGRLIAFSITNHGYALRDELSFTLMLATAWQFGGSLRQVRYIGRIAQLVGLGSLQSLRYQGTGSVPAWLVGALIGSTLVSWVAHTFIAWSQADSNAQDAQSDQPLTLKDLFVQRALPRAAPLALFLLYAHQYGQSINIARAAWPALTKRINLVQMIPAFCAFGDLCAASYRHRPLEAD